jgi:hypothetical protein
MASNACHFWTMVSGGLSLAVAVLAIGASKNGRRLKGVVEEKVCMVFAFHEAKKQRSRKWRRGLTTECWKLYLSSCRLGLDRASGAATFRKLFSLLLITPC